MTRMRTRNLDATEALKLLSVHLLIHRRYGITYQPKWQLVHAGNVS